MKSPAPGPVAVGRLGLDGDEQADRRHHGGPDKAVLAYAFEHYRAWFDELGPLDIPAFGQNLTTTGLLEPLRLSAAERPVRRCALLDEVDEIR